MARIVGINGIATRGHRSTDVMLSRLEELGHEVVDVDLPVRHTISAYWGADDDAALIASAARDGDYAIAHSFGALRLAYAMQSIDFRHVWLFRPAMRKDWEFDRPRRVTCIHSPDDWTIKLGGIVPFHPFGWAGVRGFTQTHVHNRWSMDGHSADFRTPLLDWWVDQITQKIADG